MLIILGCFFAGLANPPRLTVPKEEAQYGGDTNLTCDWGFNRNSKRVKFIHSTTEQNVGSVDLSPDGHVISVGEGIDGVDIIKEQSDERKLTLGIVHVLDRGPYQCVVEITETGGNVLRSQKEVLNLKRK